jgi:hypothetical protein
MGVSGCPTELYERSFNVTDVSWHYNYL